MKNALGAEVVALGASMKVPREIAPGLSANRK